MKRALVFGGGALLGAYDAGVAAVLCGRLPRYYFKAIYMASVGIFQGLFYAANQPGVMLDTWRNHVDGRKLIGLHKPLLRRRILDLDYLVEIFSGQLLGGSNQLNLDTAFSSGISLTCILTDFETGMPVVHRVSKGDVWETARGTCAIPYLYPAVAVAGRRVYDGGLSDAFPIAQALADGYDEVVAVYNKPECHATSRIESVFCALAGKALPRHLERLIQTMDDRRLVTEELFRDPRVRVIRPCRGIPLNSMVDTDRDRLNIAVDQGIADAQRFVY